MSQQTASQAQTDARTAFVLDVDGTLIDTVYLHVRAWSQAFDEAGLAIPDWRLHRRVGMAGRLLARVILDEEGADATGSRPKELDDAHGRYYADLRDKFARPLDGAAELLSTLREVDVPWALATSSSPSELGDLLERLGVSDDDIVVDDSDAGLAKPDPELFRAAIDQLGVAPNSAVIVGDSPWDMVAARRAGALSIGVLTGGFSASELHDGGAVRVYSGPDELRTHLPEFGIG